MNNARRKEIARCIVELTKIKHELSEIHEKEFTALTSLQELSKEDDEERIDAIDEALGYIEDTVNSVEECLDTLESADF
jgi:hypothetical protein